MDISTLNHLQLEALRDEIIAELERREAEIVALAGRAVWGCLDDFWCPVCDDRDGQVEDLESDVDNLQEVAAEALRILTDGSKTEGHRIEEAAGALEDAL